MSRLTIDEKLDQKKYCAKCKNKKRCLYAACREVDGCHLFEREPRLIDTNELIDALIELFQEIDDMYIAGRVIALIDLQPKAYDKDRVVEQLESHAIEFESFGICSDYVELSHAIEIVKGNYSEKSNSSKGVAE